MKKICSKCHIEKDVSEFYIDSKNKNRYRAACKTCMYAAVDRNKARANSKKFRNTHKNQEKERLHKYYIENKEEINKKHLKYRNNNKDKIKQHYLDNHEEIRKKQKEYQDKNRDKINAKNREYYYENFEMFAEKSKKFRENNREYVRKYAREYHRERRKDSLERFKDNVRSLIYNSLHRKDYLKSKSTEEIIGCDLDYFANYIESKFVDGMCWEGINEIHIDHIIPLATAKTEEEVIKLCHYTNLQPLWAKDNLSKGSKSQKEYEEKKKQKSNN